MNKKWLLFPLLFFLPACSSINHSFYQARALHQNEMVDNVKIGDKITVEPKTLSYDGQSKVVNGQIILPDGTSKAGDNFIIEMPGIYTVEYRAFFGVHEEKVSIFYHCHRTSGDFFQTSNNSLTFLIFPPVCTKVNVPRSFRLIVSIQKRLFRSQI